MDLVLCGPAVPEEANGDQKNSKDEWREAVFWFQEPTGCFLLGHAVRGDTRREETQQEADSQA